MSQRTEPSQTPKVFFLKRFFFFLHNFNIILNGQDIITLKKMYFVLNFAPKALYLHEAAPLTGLYGTQHCNSGTASARIWVIICVC